MSYLKEARENHPDNTLSARTPEDRLLLNKFMRHIFDVIMCIRVHGARFWANKKTPALLSKKLDSHKNAKLQYEQSVLQDGMESYDYVFSDDDNSLGFLSLCESFGINNNLIRHKLRTMTKAHARLAGNAVFALNLKGDRAKRLRRQHETTRKAVNQETAGMAEQSLL